MMSNMSQIFKDRQTDRQTEFIDSYTVCTGDNDMTYKGLRAHVSPSGKGRTNSSQQMQKSVCLTVSLEQYWRKKEETKQCTAYRKP